MYMAKEGGRNQEEVEEPVAKVEWQLSDLSISSSNAFLYVLAVVCAGRVDKRPSVFTLNACSHPLRWVARLPFALARWCLSPASVPCPHPPTCRPNSPPPSSVCVCCSNNRRLFPTLYSAWNVSRPTSPGCCLRVTLPTSSKNPCSWTFWTSVPMPCGTPPARKSCASIAARRRACTWAL